MPSIFSRIVAGELPAYKVAEDEHHLAFLDITPLVEGHTLVIPKREVDYIFDLPPAELAALHLFAQRVATGVRAAVPCKRVGVAVIGLEVPHAHIHLIPMNKVADMNFANPKIQVDERRMNALAAAIGAQVPAVVAGTPELPADPRDTKGGRETVEASEPDAFQAPTPDDAASDAMASANTASTAPEPLRELTKGLKFVSEAEAPLEPVSFVAPAGGLTDAALCQLAGVPAGTAIERQELTYLLRNHTADQGVAGSPEAANQFKQLQMYLKQELSGTQVYRFGSGPQVPVLALGEGEGGQLQGFKTVLTET